MKYRERATGAVRTQPEIQALLTNIFVPLEPTYQFLDSIGYDAVNPVSPSAVYFDRETQMVRVNGVEYANGNWQERLEVVTLEPSFVAQRLADAKAAKRAQINSWRDTANTTSFAFMGKGIACDALSARDMDKVGGYISLFGTFPPDFPGGWKTIDNSYIPMPSIADFKAMYAAMVAQGTVNFNNSQALKAAVDAATTLAQINAITWN